MAAMPAPAAPAESANPHIAAVIGGATAGAEVAGRLAGRGVRVVVFEMNPRPYGKIEDGLPRWHEGLRRKEYENIAAKLARPGVDFVPRTRVGADLDFGELCRDWGFSAVVLANGAWRDRPLPVPGAEEMVGRGLIYQNPFIIWFNHSCESDYAGECFTPQDDVLVVGGGLASIDVAKVLMLETTRAALAGRGIHAELLELEVKGIPRLLSQHGIAFADLGLTGCTLFYRRRAEDMPLVEIPENAEAKLRDKMMTARGRLLQKAMDKYLFRFEPLSAPESLIVEEGRVAGLRLQRTRIENGRVVGAGEHYERRGAYVISSIGSIPEPIPGIEMKGELFDFSDWDIGRLPGYPNLFSVGNVVTGKGNIVASRKHAGQVCEAAIESFLGLTGEHGAEAQLAGADAALAARAEAIADEIGRAAPPSPQTAQSIFERVRARQQAVGYRGDLQSWLAEVTPPDFA